MDNEPGFNPENSEFTEKKEVNFSSAESFDQLYDMIRAAGSVVGSRQIYEAEFLIDAIEKVRRGELTFDYITNTGNLRNTVWRLMQEGGGHMLPDKSTGEPRYRVIGLMSEGEFKVLKDK